MEPTQPDPVDEILAFHVTTKHHPHAYARGPASLDWETQPDPFRRYADADLRRLDLAPIRDVPGPAYDAAHAAGGVPAAPLDLRSLSRLFHDSLALSAWKSAGGQRWALRVNPSSGNLHPTEGYLVCGPVAGLTDTPFIAHYAPREHALEIRTELLMESWNRLAAGLPAGAILVGLTSIHWREAWKYGERAYRYCQHDVGHALAAVAIAAGALGWRVRVLEDVASDEIAALLGVANPGEAEPEAPDCLVAVFPGPPGSREDRESRTAASSPPGPGTAVPAISESAFRALGEVDFRGRPNALSADHVQWPIIERAARAVEKPRTPPGEAPPIDKTRPDPAGRSPARGDPDAARSLFLPTIGRTTPIRPILHGRRSAVSMDGRTVIERDAFFRILQATVPVAGRAPFDIFPEGPRVDLAIFVHPRVRDIPTGLYALARDPARLDRLRATFRDDFLWAAPPGRPEGLGLYLLARGDARAVAAEISCHQRIASDGCFSLGMIADFEGPIRQHGAWIYPRLFRECGAIGQVLYLEAEAAGVRGTGIGCFFDDAMHRILGIEGLAFQSLYHFTIGGPVEDDRITTLPAYPERGG